MSTNKTKTSLSANTDIKFRKPYDRSIPVRVSFPNATPVKQSFKDQCDINKIMSRFEKTGVIEHTQAVQGSYGDFTGIEDYQQSVNRVIAAEHAFMALPSKIRARFDNDPSELLEFMSDDANKAEAIELGLLPSKPSDIAAEGRQSKPAEPLKAVPATPENPEPQPQTSVSQST